MLINVLLNAQDIQFERAFVINLPYKVRNEMGYERESLRSQCICIVLIAVFCAQLANELGQRVFFGLSSLSLSWIEAVRSNELLNINNALLKRTVN